MMSLTIQVDDQLLMAVIAQASALGISTAEFAEKAIRAALSSGPMPSLAFDDELPAVRQYGPHIEKAMRRLKRLEDGITFTLNGNFKGWVRLFSTEEWAQMVAEEGFSPNIFGKQFLQYIKRYNRKHGPIAKILPKTSDNKQPYRKVGALASE
jgi:hypothetical protein